MSYKYGTNLINIKEAPYGAKGDGVTDDTTAIQNAITTFSSLAGTNGANGGISPELYFPPGTYVINSRLNIGNIKGGHIRGAGKFQTILQTGSGFPIGDVVLRLTNCQHTSVSDMTIWGYSRSTTITAGVAAGATSVTVSSASGMAAGQTVALVPPGQNADGYNCEVLQISSVSGTTITFTSGLLYAHSANDVIILAPYALLQSYSDHADAGYKFNPTANVFERINVGSSAIYACIYGFSIDCNGGTGSSSDANNDDHLFFTCQCDNAGVAGVNIGHLNALGETFMNCAMGGSYAYDSQTGGSARIIGGIVNSWACDFRIGGQQEHPWLIDNAYTESGAQFLVNPPFASKNDIRCPQQLKMYITNYDKKGGTNGTSDASPWWLINFTGTGTFINAVNSFFSVGTTFAGILFHEYQTSLFTAGPGSYLQFMGCDLAPYIIDLDASGLQDFGSRWGASDDGYRHETLGHTSQIETFSSYNWNANNAQYKIGELRGIRGISGLSSGLVGQNVAGTVTVSGSNTSSTAAINQEPDTNYRVALTPVSYTGTPAIGSNRIVSVTKTTTSIDVFIETAPGTGNSIVFEYIIMRS